MIGSWRFLVGNFRDYWLALFQLALFHEYHDMEINVGVVVSSSSSSSRSRSGSGTCAILTLFEIVSVTCIEFYCCFIWNNHVWSRAAGAKKRSQKNFYLVQVRFVNIISSFVCVRTSLQDWILCSLNLSSFYGFKPSIHVQCGGSKANSLSCNIRRESTYS
jgi:hypothetical protein